MGEADFLAKIDEYVGNALENLDESEMATLRALLFFSYRGGRDYVVKDLLKMMGCDEIKLSELTEEFQYVQEGETARYIRIKPEYFRAVRRRLRRSE